MHRLFLDPNVRIEIAQSLAQDGNKVVHATEANLQRRDDEAVFLWAVEREMTIVTFDSHFAERAYWHREPHCGIVRLRVEPQTPDVVLPLLRRFLASWPPEKIVNALVVVDENKVRVRHY